MLLPAWISARARSPPSPSSLVNHQVSAYRILDCRLSPGQTIMTRSNANGYHHTSACHVRHTNLQEPSRANFTYPSPIRRRTFANHDDVHAGTLQTAIHARPPGIIACRHARFSSRRLRHRLHTQDGLTQKPCHSGHQSRQSTSRNQLHIQACMQKPLKHRSDKSHCQYQE